MAVPRAISGWAIAPFGRIGRALGWRWIFYFTFPIPFHPWLARALPLLFAAWIGWLALRTAPGGWLQPLWAALILAVPLSVPFLQWILFAFRLHLLQALMLPAALLLLAVAAGRGDEPAWLAVFPACFFLGHGAAALHGRWRLRGWQRDNAAVEGMADGRGPLPALIVSLPHHAEQTTLQLLGRLGLPAAYSRAGDDTRLVVRVDDPGLVARLDALRGKRRDGVRVLGGGPTRAVALTADAPAAPWLLAPIAAIRPRTMTGEIGGVEATHEGRGPLRYWHGRPAPLAWLPGFYFFFALRLGATARFTPEFGFLPAAVRPLGREGDAAGACTALAAALRLDGSAPAPFFDPAFVHRRLDAEEEARFAAEIEALARLLADPARWTSRPLDNLLGEPAQYADRAEELVAAFRAARDARAVAAVLSLAHLIAALPKPAFLRIGGALLDALDSKLLAGRREPSVEEVTLGKIPFEGFRLLTRVPRLYVRLAELGEPARPFIEALARAFPRAEPPRKAKARLDAAAR